MNSTMEESPISKAHQHANVAEEYESRGLFKEAAQEHLIAADNFEMAIEFTSDAEVIRTLQLLSSAHKRHGFEIERKLTKNLSQKRNSRSENDHNTILKTSPAIDAVTSRYVPSTVKFKSGHLNSAPISPSHTSEDPNSYIHNEDRTSNPFDRFWETVEILIENPSSPTIFEEMMNVGIGEVEVQHTNKDEDDTEGMLGSFIIVPEHHVKLENSSKGSTECDSKIPEMLSESLSILIPSSDQPKATSSIKTIEEYMIENQHLKSTIDILSRQMGTLEKVTEENTLLKSSILQLRQDVHKQSKRKHSRSEFSHQHGPSAYEIALQKNVQELEEKVRLLKVENAKQNMMLSKYRDRWDQLKESAKKKRVAVKGGQQDLSANQIPVKEFNDKLLIMEKRDCSGDTQTASFPSSPREFCEGTSLDIMNCSSSLKRSSTTSPSIPANIESFDTQRSNEQIPYSTTTQNTMQF
ncbi:hypothetical protein K7432_001555 [Basidiobolus ranarum]|uniref:Uncharacterized protein n=1 Tax=Basidiobolus ranarum TaxID=34480 RepID=A0ABR2W9F8_9FUNG